MVNNSDEAVSYSFDVELANQVITHAIISVDEGGLTSKTVGIGLWVGLLYVCVLCDKECTTLCSMVMKSLSHKEEKQAFSKLTRQMSSV